MGSTHSRRRGACFGGAFLLCIVWTSAVCADAPHGAASKVGARAPSPLFAGAAEDGIDSPEMALAELIMGNRRFVLGKRTRTVDSASDPVLRARLAEGQQPFAVVVTCSDSRVPDNILFDQEPGRLFTIREAGNSPDLQGIASADYAIEHLHARVVVVMGHTSCGAVKAVQGARGKPLPGNLWAFQSAMAGLLESTPPRPKENDIAYNARLVEANARRQAQALADRSDVIAAAVKSGRVWVVPAIYDLSSGQVRFVDRVAPTPTTAGEHQAPAAAAHATVGPAEHPPQTRK